MFKAIKIVAVILLIILLGGFIAFQVMFSRDYVDEPLLKNQIQKTSITINGESREFLWYAPPQLSSKTALLFVLHGSTGSGTEIRKQMAYQFDQLADEKGFVVVYPTGYFNHWNDCRGTADYQANLDDVDDIAFLKAIESHISQAVNKSFSYQFATGHSNGGHFCLKLALEVPNWIDGIAPISANIPIEENLDCNNQNQFVPIFLLNGTEDAINPYEGGLVSLLGNDSRGTVLSTDQTISYWAQLGNCHSTPEITKVADANSEDESQVEQYEWQCDSITQIRLYKIINGGHTIPSTVQKFPRMLGTTNQDFDAPKVIWEFFEQLQ